MRQWDGELITWFPSTRVDLENVFALELMVQILDPNFPVPTSSSPNAKQKEYKFCNAYAYGACLVKAITSSQAKVITTSMGAKRMVVD